MPSPSMIEREAERCPGCAEPAGERHAPCCVELDRQREAAQAKCGNCYGLGFVSRWSELVGRNVTDACRECSGTGWKG